jgi:heavy metal sensor kinase
VNFLKSIRLRLTMWYVAVLALLLLAFGIIIYYLLASNLDRRMYDDIVLREEHLADTVTARGAVDPEAVPLFQLRPDEMTAVFNSNGVAIGKAGLEVAPDIINYVMPQALNNFSVYFDSETVDGVPLHIYVAPLKVGSQVVGAVAFGRTTADIVSVLEAFTNTALLTGIGVILLAATGGLFLTSRAMKPVSVINRAARDIGSGDLGRRIQVADSGEIGNLAATLNHMFDRLQAAFSREKRFTSDASHELRTPLSIIEAEATLALDKNRPLAEYRRSLGVIAQEADHMSRLINDMLFLARSDAGRERLELKPIKLGGFIEDLVSDISVLSKSRGLTMKYTGLDDPIVIGDEMRLRQLFLNIMENAIRYTSQGGRVSVSVAAHESKAIVGIADTGVGITAEALEHIFEPFYRADEGRTREAGGTGLGLAIGQRIARAHSGEITVTSEPGRGSTFSVSLPLASGKEFVHEPLDRRANRFFPRKHLFNLLRESNHRTDNQRMSVNGQ